jgi:hypothetical protein
MRDASKDKSSSYLRQLSAQRESLVITQNSDAKAVLQDLASC